jgi:hypothetical protein
MSFGRSYPYLGTMNFGGKVGSFDLLPGMEPGRHMVT